jgi:hypothetical protein
MKVLLALVAALVLAAPANAYGVFPLFNQVASEVAGRPVEVRCGYVDDWRPMDPTWTAYTWWGSAADPEYVVLSPQICWSLILLAVDPNNEVAGSLSSGNHSAVWRQGEAVITLAHEAVHMTGMRDEGQTECRALDYIDLVITRFGVGEARAKDVREAALASHSVQPPAYRTAC